MSVNVHSPPETANFEPAVAGLIFRTVAAPEEFDPTTVTGLSGSFTAKFSVMSERRITLFWVSAGLSSKKLIAVAIELTGEAFVPSPDDAPAETYTVFTTGLTYPTTVSLSI